MVKSAALPRLQADDQLRHAQALAVLLASFADRERYGEERLRQELVPLPQPFYREFFLIEADQQVVGIGGVKAAEWASDTHILYLSAVADDYRGQGLARALLAARLEWLHEQFKHGRVLVSSAKTRRFREAGFKSISKTGKSGRELLLLEF